jgi:YHS domain-containing protein
MGLDVERESFPDADMTFDRLDRPQLTITRNTYIVIASHGDHDEDMLVAALHSKVPYVSLIAGEPRSTATVHFTSEFAGKIYHACAAGCKRSFDKEPQNIFNQSLPSCER